MLACGKSKREGCRRKVTEGMGGGLAEDSVRLMSVKEVEMGLLLSVHQTTAYVHVTSDQL